MTDIVSISLLKLFLIAILNCDSKKDNKNEKNISLLSENQAKKIR